MLKALSAILLVLALFLPATSIQAGAKPGLTAERAFEMADGLKLHVWISRPMVKEPAPLLVLLPMRGHDHRSYDSLRGSVMHRAISFGNDKISWPYVAAFDLRGHGRSIEKGNSEIRFNTMPEEEYMKIPQDVADALEKILADSSYNIDPDNILVVGASIGANSAIMLTEHLDGIRKVAMLSPGQRYLGLEPEPALMAFGGDVIMFASQQDRYSYSSAKIMSEKKPERCTFEEFFGNKHGTDIINAYPEAMYRLIDWLFEEREQKESEVED